jgi:hypothetical protein
MHIYEDTNYDTKDLALFRKRGMLRERVRYDKRPWQKKYKFRKAVFQAKIGPLSDASQEAALFAREEIRGTEYTKRKKFFSDRDDLLDSKSEDRAVQFARDLSASKKRFRPVLFIRDKRFFMTLKKVGAADPLVPWFYVSLDRVKYTGLVGAKGQARRLEFEAEMNDDLAAETPDAARAKLHLLKELTQYIERELGLKPSPESKYESGVALTVLSSIFSNGF